MIHQRIAILLLIFFYLTIFCLSVFSQALVDPNARIYRMLAIWQENGFLKYLPPIRPYAPQLVKKLLSEVIEKGSDADRKLAKDYYDYYFPQQFDEPNVQNPYIDVNSCLALGTITDFHDYFGKLVFNWNSTGLLSDLVSYSWLLSISIIDNPQYLISPLWSEPYDESRTGGGQLGLSDNTIEIGQLGLGGLFIGTDYLFSQAGLMRTSFGPFFDNSPIVGAQCPAAGHFSLTYITEWICFSSLFLDLVAQYYEDQDTGERERFKEPKSKFLVIHSFTAYPFSWFNIGFIQAVLFGEIFHPLYLVPLHDLFYTQQFLGDWDSSFIGFSGQLVLPWNIQFNAVFYVDDWDAFSSQEKQEGSGINFDSAQNKFALQLGLNWSPPVPVFKSIRADYLIITPYTYTHSARSAVEYLAYTHAGEHLGSVLEPNSDQTTLSILLMPAAYCDLDFWSRFARHANASEGLEQGDGTIFDDGYLSDGTVTFYGPGRFLTQDVIEYLLQTGLDMDFNFYLDWARIFFKIGYTFEYIWNKDLNNGAEEVNNFISLDLGIEI